MPEMPEPQPQPQEERLKLSIPRALWRDGLQRNAENNTETVVNKPVKSRKPKTPTEPVRASTRVRKTNSLLKDYVGFGLKMKENEVIIGGVIHYLFF
jgi:hypothetical protein